MKPRPVHRTLLRFIFAQCFMAAALITKDPVLLGALSAAGIGAVLLTPTRIRPLIKALTMQTVVIAGLYALRFGPDRVAEGLLVSWKLLLAYIPFAVLAATTQSSELAAALGRWLPPLTAFVIASCLRFFPHLIREALDIYRMQRLRGACLSITQAWRPAFWHDIIHCLAVPVLAQAFTYAHQAAVAARARNLGIASGAVRESR